MCRVGLRTASVIACCVMGLGPPGAAAAQEVQGRAAQDGAAAAQPPGEETTLPPVVVRPPDEASSTAPRTSPAPGPFDLPRSYPRLREQTFSGLNGVLRNGRSLWDAPSFGSIAGRSTLDQRQPSDMARTLQTEVGILMQQTARGQASPFIRGLTGQQTLILVDGVRLNNSTFRAGPNQYFNLIDPGQVNRVEVVRGPQGVLWGGDAIGGVINVVTRTADRNRGNYAGGSVVEYFSTADAGSYSRASAEGALGGGSMFAGLSYLNVNDLTRGGGQGRQPFTNYDQYAADLKFQYLLDNDTLLTFAGQHFEQDNVPRSDRFLPFVLGPPTSIQRPTFFDPQQRDLFYARIEGLGGGRWCDAYTHTFSFQNHQEGSRELRFTSNAQAVPPTIDISYFDVRTLGWTSVFAKDFDLAGRFTWGADWYYDDVDATRRRVTGATGALVAAQPPPQFPDDSIYERAGAFLNWDVPLLERLDFVTGLRYEYARAAGTPRINGVNTYFQRTYHGWVSGAGLVYRAAENLNLVGNVTQGYRAPNLDDLTADVTFLQNLQTAPSLDVKPEYPISYEAGLKLDTPRLRVQAVEFWMDLQSYIRRVGVGGGNAIRVNSQALLSGTEISGEYLFERGFSVYGNFWHIDGQDVVFNDPFSRIPPTQGILGWRWRQREGRRWVECYTWLVARQDRYSLLNLADSRFPAGGTAAYATFNVRLGAAFSRRHTHQLTLNLENLSNTPYRVLGSGVDGAGINGILGYEWVR